MTRDKRLKSPPTPGLKLVWGFTLLLLLLTWSAIAYKIRSELQHEIGNINRTNLNLAQALQEHTLRTLKSVDQAVLFLKFSYQREGKQVDIPRYVHEGMILGSLFNQLGIIDEHGSYIMSNLPHHKVIDLSDREHFKFHIARDCQCLFISKPVLGRASGKWSIQMTRRINKADGRFGGAVVVSLDPYYFVRLYSEMDLGAKGVITLLGDDGIVRVRKSGNDVTFGQSLSSSPAMALSHKARQGVYSLRSIIDGTTRFYAFHHLPDYPFMVLVGVSEDAALADFHTRERGYLLFGALVSLTLLAFALATTRLLRRLIEARARAEEANRLKSDFLASVSHELRTPLNGIIGYAELVQEEEDRAMRREFAGVIQTSGHHLLNLVNSILDLARVEAGQVRLDMKPIVVRELIHTILASYQPMAAEKGLALTQTIADDVPPNLNCDAMRLTQVLNNLLHNALKFTREGEVALAVTRETGRVRFTVRDTGPGIAKNEQRLVFEKFRQVVTFENRRHDGVGLGLALSRQLVELMGGELALDSTPGKGSTFTFTLPQAPVRALENTTGDIS
ncbi:ATP-binding protein [Paludibacterium yongneupense]|uniref:cache domain-containing sensor histidine kinase n=1 Tax=Paludibacterium yongneupense TaxID=400061 RepID=UPI000A013586|nr:ATP-binding protein [Paludibacterium yongneupense]